MTTDEIKQLSKQLKAECNNIDGLPDLNDDTDNDGNSTGSLNETVDYLVDVTRLLDDRQIKLSNLPEFVGSVAGECAKEQAERDAEAKYKGDQFGKVKIKVRIDDGEESFNFLKGKPVVNVVLKIEVEATQPNESPEPEFCGVLKQWV